MRPVDIGAHPDAPHHYITFGKPADWSDEDCESLAVRRVGASGDVLAEPSARVVRQDRHDGEPIYPCFMSEWRPTQDELDRLMKGEPIRMLISGNSLPPVALWVREESEI